MKFDVNEVNLLKIIKKTIISLSLAIYLLMLSATGVFAVLMSYEINDIGLKIDIPNEYKIILRDTPSDDTVFSEMGLSYDTVKENFQSSNLYLQGYSSDKTKIISVTMTVDDSSKEIVSYSRLDQAQLDTILQGFSSSEMYKNSKVEEIGDKKLIYLEFERRANDVEIYGVQGNIVENGMNYNIILQKTGSPLTSDEKSEFTSVIKSVEIREPDTGAFTGNMILTLLIVFLGAVVVILFVVILKGKSRKAYDGSSNSRKLPSYIDGQEADDLMVVRAKPVEKHDYVTKSIDEAISNEKNEAKENDAEGKKEEYLDKFFDNKGENIVPERKEKKKNFLEKRQEKKQAEKREKSLEAFKNAKEYNVFDDQEKGDDKN